MSLSFTPEFFSEPLIKEVGFEMDLFGFSFSSSNFLLR